MKASPGEIRVLQSTTATAVPTGADVVMRAGEPAKLSQPEDFKALLALCCQKEPLGPKRTRLLRDEASGPSCTTRCFSLLQACTFLPFN